MVTHRQRVSVQGMYEEGQKRMVNTRAHHFSKLQFVSLVGLEFAVAKSLGSLFSTQMALVLSPGSYWASQGRSLVANHC